MSNARILVVDDEADIRELVQEILSEEGYTVDVAANAAEVERHRSGKKDLHSGVFGGAAGAGQGFCRGGEKGGGAVAGAVGP